MANTHQDRLRHRIANIIYQNSEFVRIAEDFRENGQVIALRTGGGKELEDVVEEIVGFVEENYDRKHDLEEITSPNGQSLCGAIFDEEGEEIQLTANS